MRKLYLLIIPFIIYVWGLNYGLPMHLIGDEESLIGGALKMIEFRQLFPIFSPDSFSFLYYPPVIPYINIIFYIPLILFKLISLSFNLTELKDYFIFNLDSIWINSRIITAFFSLGLLVVIYKLAKELFSKHAAYLSVILLSFSFYHVVLSHWMRHWIFSLFFIYLTILLAVLLSKGKLKKYWLLGVVASLSFTTTYISVIGFIFALVILYLSKDKILNFSKIVWRNILVFILLGGGLALVNLPDVLRIVAREATSGEVKSILGFLKSFVDFGVVMINQELVIFILLIASVILWSRNKVIKIFILAFSLFYFVILYWFVHFETRYVYFLIPSFVLLAADFLTWLKSKIPNKIFYLFFIVIMSWPIICALRYNYLITVSDTRELAVDYVNNNFDDNFLLLSEDIYFTRIKDSLNIADQYGHINSRDRYLLSNYDNISIDLGKKYNYQNIHFWDEEFKNKESIAKYIDEYNPSYFVVQYWDRNDVPEYYNELLNSDNLVKIFKQSDLGVNYDINANFWAFNTILFKLDRLGPTIEIYKLK